MTMTFGQLQSRVRQQLLGFTKDQEQYSNLTASITSSSTTFSLDLDTVGQMSSGLVEIDDELLLIKKIDRVTGVATVMAGVNGRGRESTTAASHADQAIVISDPLFPRQAIKQAIQDSIQGVYPDVYPLVSSNITKSAPVFEYGLPATVDDVMQVTFDTVGPTQVNPPSVRWRFNSFANLTRFPTGKSLIIEDPITSGRVIKVTYMTSPANPVADADDLSVVTGWSSAEIDRYSDMFVYGACARLLPSYESARLQQGAVESMERAALVQAGAALQTAAYYQKQYKDRIQEERRRLQELHSTYQRYQS